MTEEKDGEEMTRDIKLKAWDKKNKCWIEKFYLHFPSGHIAFFAEGPYMPIEDTTVELVGCTDQTDTDGKEICERDTIETYAFVDEVVWYRDRWAFSRDVKHSPFTYHMGGTLFKVIGNIYENPELLEGDE